MSALLEAAQLRVAVPGRTLIDSFDCTIRAGEFIALLGGNLQCFRNRFCPLGARIAQDPKHRPLLEKIPGIQAMRDKFK